MAIEVTCPGCQKTLRVPDTAAGKQARCPACQQVLTIPQAPAPAPAEPPSPFSDQAAPTARPGGFQPFAAAPPPAESGYKPVLDPTNPYAPSAHVEEDIAATAPGVLVHRRFSFEEVISGTWRIFSANMGSLVILGLILLGVQIVFQVINQVTNLVAQAINEPWVLIAHFVGMQLLNIAVAPILFLGPTFACMRLLREGRTEPGDFLQFTRFYVTGILMTLLMYVIFLGVYAVCIGPPIAVMALAGDPMIGGIALIIGGLVTMFVVIYLVLMFLLTSVFIVDRQVGAIECLKMSWRFMQGNALTALLLSIVVSILGGLFVCVTCVVGVILVAPFWWTMTCVMYMLATGQKHAIHPHAWGAQGKPPGF